MSKLGKYKQGRWKRYNAWRAQNRELDRARRLQRVAEKRQTVLDGYVLPVCPMPRRPKAWARVRIYFADGTSAGFSVRCLPGGGLSVSPTLAGRKVSAVLQNYKPLSTCK